MTSRRRPLRADLLIDRGDEVLTCVPKNGDLVGRIAGGSIAISGDTIVAVGPAAEVERQVDLSGARVMSASGLVAAPGFIDCHTHLVFSGSRVEEYAATVSGNLEELARRGVATGIQATVALTRGATTDELVQESGERLKRMFWHGTTTVESKTGYGLDRETELRMLTTNRELDERYPPDVVSTFLGAHDFPPGKGRREYIDLLVEEMIPQAASKGLAEFCDVYCDQGYYTVEESRVILRAGQASGLSAKIHADAYAEVGAGSLAAEVGAVSADHLNFASAKTLRLLAATGVVGVAMPALDFAVAHPRPSNVRAMLGAGMTVALATDICPGCWAESMQLVVALACRTYGLSPEQAIWSATAGAARALARADRGTLEPGKLADIQLWDVPRHEHIAYRIGSNAVAFIVRRGRVFDVGQSAS